MEIQIKDLKVEVDGEQILKGLNLTVKFNPLRISSPSTSTLRSLIWISITSLNSLYLNNIR